jgi:outer membrane protein OmpA-like peptidoglycan-associated protein
MITSPLSKRWFIILTMTLALFAALLVGTPFLIKHLARQWLLENGGSQVQFRDVDFNPFSGTLVLEDLDVKVDQETTLSFASAGLDLAWLPLFQKQITVQSVELAGFRILIDNRDVLRIGGIRLPQASPETESEPQESSSSGWLSGIDSLALRDFEIVYRDPTITTTLVLDRLLFSGLAQWTPDQAAQLELSGSLNGAPVELNAELAPLAETADYRGTLSVRGLALDDFAGLAQPQLQELAGTVTLDSDFTVQQTQGSLTLSHTGKLSLADLKLVNDAMQIASQSGNWDGELQLNRSADELRIAHSGGLVIEQIKLVSSAGDLDNQSAKWQGTTAVALIGPDQRLTLQTDGNLSLAALKLVSSALQLDSQAGSWNGKLELTQSPDALSISHNGGLTVEQIKLASDAGVIDNRSTQWDGTTAVELVGPEQALTLRTEGELVLGETTADLQQPLVYFEQQRFSHQGSVSFSQAEAGPAVTASSSIALERLRLVAEQRKFQLLDVAALRVSGLQVDAPDQLAIDTVQLDELYLGESVNPDPNSSTQRGASLHIVQTRLSEPRYANRLLSIDSIEYDGYHAQLHRNKDGEWAIVRFLDVIQSIAQGSEPAGENAVQASAEGAATTAQNDASAAPPLQLAIKRIAAGKDSKLGFLDESVKPVFKTELNFEQLKIENIDSRRPEQPTSLVLESKMGKYTRVALQGDLQPFLQPPGLNLKGSIGAMDLPQLSSYTRDSLGLLLNSGTLDADLAMQTQADTLDGKATLKLHQLQVKSVPGENTLQSKIPVPLDTALDTLRDKNNTIKLEIPVAGNINDPKFNVNDAISQALAKGVQKGALSYLTLALQPYGTLITAAKYAGEAATRVRLNPVEFEPGQSVLDDSDREYLDKVAKVLKDRPKIAIKLCGVAASQDRLFLQQQQQKQQQPQQAAKTPAQEQGTAPLEAPLVDETKLSEIAEQRAAAVKDFLIEKHQVPASRLVGCLPQLEIDDANTQPRTDLLI